jgi:tetratricopeptide (TPR) repeat protein
MPTAPEHAPLQEMSASEAVQLFVTRAQATQHDFALTVENAQAVGAICRRLDGLPLAIELAAARVKVFPPDAMLNRLGLRLPLLLGGPRDMPSRQRTMRDAIEWSHDLLTRAERTLFRRLAVFVGGGSLEAVEAVANAEGDLEIVEVLSALVDHSLLKQVPGIEGEPRYSMLETVREYGLEELAVSGEETEIRRRHAAWCLDAAVTAGHVLWTDYNPRVVERLETELANLRTAKDWFEQAGDNTALTQLAAALGYFLYLSRHYREGRDWMERVLAIREPPTAEHARIMLWSGILDIGLGDDNAALKRLEQSADLARQLDLPDVEGVAVLGQGIVLEDRADYAEAEALLIRSLALLRKAGNDVVVPQAMYHLGVVAYGRGEMTLARERWEEALALAQDQGNAVATRTSCTGRVNCSPPALRCGRGAGAARDGKGQLDVRRHCDLRLHRRVEGWQEKRGVQIRGENFRTAIG